MGYELDLWTWTTENVMEECLAVLWYLIAEHASVKFSPAVLEPEGVIFTAPISTDYKEKDKQ